MKHNIISISFGQRISELRRDRGLTQERFAEKLGVSTRTVASWETDEHNPPLKMMKEIAITFGITLMDLFACVETNDVKRAFTNQNLRRLRLNEIYDTLSDAERDLLLRLAENIKK